MWGGAKGTEGVGVARNRAWDGLADGREAVGVLGYGWGVSGVGEEGRGAGWRGGRGEERGARDRRRGGRRVGGSSVTSPSS